MRQRLKNFNGLILNPFKPFNKEYFDWEAKEIQNSLSKGSSEPKILIDDKLNDIKIRKKIIWNNFKIIFQNLSQNVRDKILVNLAWKEKSWPKSSKMNIISELLWLREKISF